jgi:hypothetical protein
VICARTKILQLGVRGRAFFRALRVCRSPDIIYEAHHRPVWLDCEIISFFTAPGRALKLPSSGSTNRFRAASGSQQEKDGRRGSGPLVRIGTFRVLVYLLDGEQKTRRKYHVAEESFARCHQTAKQTHPTGHRG